MAKGGGGGGRGGRGGGAGGGDAGATRGTEAWYTELLQSGRVSSDVLRTQIRDAKTVLRRNEGILADLEKRFDKEFRNVNLDGPFVSSAKRADHKRLLERIKEARDLIASYERRIPAAEAALKKFRQRKG